MSFHGNTSSGKCKQLGRPKSSSRTRLSSAVITKENGPKNKEPKKTKTLGSVMAKVRMVSPLLKSQLLGLLTQVESRMLQMWDCLESIHIFFENPEKYDSQILDYTEYLADISNQTLALLSSYSRMLLFGEERSSNDSVRLSSVLAQYHSMRGHMNSSQSNVEEDTAAVQLTQPESLKYPQREDNPVISIIGCEPTPHQSSVKPKFLNPQIPNSQNSSDSPPPEVESNGMSHSKKKRPHPISLDISPPPRQKTPLEDVATRKTNLKLSRISLWEQHNISNEFTRVTKDDPAYTCMAENADVADPQDPVLKFPLRLRRKQTQCGEPEHAPVPRGVDLKIDPPSYRLQNDSEQQSRPEIVIIDSST